MATHHLTYQLPHRFPIALVRLSGELSTASMRPAHTALVEALMEEPTAVVVDMSGLQSADETAMALFPSIGKLAREWPGARLLLGALRPRVAAALPESGWLSQHDTVDQALAEASTDPVPQRVHRYLEPTVEAPKLAREMATHAWWDWGLDGRPSSAQVLASELVTNGVRHARTPLGFSITLRGETVRVSVQDWAPAPVRQRSPAETDLHGRGLIVVEAIAERWGSVPLGDGKVVWAELTGFASSERQVQ
jgi:ABC-type transporter Mla MlaB component